MDSEYVMNGKYTSYPVMRQNQNASEIKNLTSAKDCIITEIKKLSFVLRIPEPKRSNAFLD